MEDEGRCTVSAAECRALDPPLHGEHSRPEEVVRVGFVDAGNLVPTELPLQFRFEFSVARFEAGRSSCDVFPKFERFNEAQRARLAALIGIEARARATAEMSIAFRDTCRSSEPDPAVVALGICPWATGGIGGDLIFHEHPLKPEARSAFAHHTVDTKSARYEAFALAAFLPKVASNGMGNLVDRLDRLADGELAGVTPEYWLNASRTVLVLSEKGDRNPEGSGIRVAIVTEKSFKIAPIPIAFGQYGDDKVAGISDSDADGNIEVWITATLGECDGEGEQRPGIDCAFESYHRFEQFGDSLLPYVEGPRPKLSDNRTAQPATR